MENKKTIVGGVEFLPLNSPAVKKKLAEKLASSFPRLSTLVGEGTVYPLVGWVTVSLKGREPFEVPCLAAETKDGKTERVTVAALAAKGDKFTDASGKEVLVKNLFPHIPGESVWERNSRILSLIPTKGIKISAHYVHGKYEGESQVRDHYVVEPA